MATASGCGSVQDAPGNPPPDAPAGNDTGSEPDAPRPGLPAGHCDPGGRFDPPIAIPGLENTGLNPLTPRLTPDEKTLYFGGNLANAADTNIYLAVRRALDQPFDRPQLVTALNSAAPDFDPSLSSDGLAMWFGSSRATNQGERIYIARRNAASEAFGGADPAPINSTDTRVRDVQPFVTADNTEVWFATSRGNSLLDIWRSIRVNGGYNPPEAVSELNSTGYEMLPTLSVDRLTIYFSSTRGGNFDIWRARRASVRDAFGMPEAVTELNTNGLDQPGWLSEDNCRLYGSSAALGLFVATRRPPT